MLTVTKGDTVTNYASLQEFATEVFDLKVTDCGQVKLRDKLLPITYIINKDNYTPTEAYYIFLSSTYFFDIIASEGYVVVLGSLPVPKTFNALSYELSKIIFDGEYAIQLANYVTLYNPDTIAGKAVRVLLSDALDIYSSDEEE